ncbi:unnamed protein product [Adineta steineri]|uniref:TLC domain-containing protein n=1 Tax=Adineta steineri TaxID=433720 RepID=A0A816EMV0_9BILA|nr:unnamed protein product [Adineta steineri]CAF1515967.1 unnamed protein product [Adineta steineri]CAF1648700.1 unnamed protein product [Adineta steineri]
MVAINITLGVSWTVLSFGFFVICRYLVQPLTFIRHSPKTHRTKSNPYFQTCFTCADDHQWERLNLLISWLHSLITGVAVIYSFWAYSPDIYQDLVNHITLVTYLTCALSYGYFWYDLCDIISNRRGSEMLELLLHHILTIIFFSFNIFRVLNIGYQMFALIAEVNSIFLHARKLFQLYHIPRDNVFVRLNMFLNILTFFLCRLCMLFFVTIFVYHDRYRVGDINYIYVMYVLLPGVWIINPILFYRVLRTDFLKRYKSKKLLS